MMLCASFVQCSKDDGEESVKEPEVPVLEVSEHLQEIMSHPFVDASFAVTGRMSLVEFQTERYDDKYGKDALICVDVMLSYPSYTEIPEESEIRTIEVKRQWNYYNVYWKMQPTSYGSANFQGLIKFKKIEGNTYRVELEAGPIADQDNKIIDKLEIKYTGEVSFGAMLEY